MKPLFDSIRVVSELAEGASFALSAQHIAALNFREIRVSEAFTVIDASGGFFRASLTTLEGESGTALAYERMQGPTESPARITLLCAVLGRQRMITVVQKATELGCVQIIPVLSERSVQPKELAKEKPWAWQGQAKKASRQCRRSSVPEVRETQPLAKALASEIWTHAQCKFFLDDRITREGDPFARAGASGDYVLAVGPEGGWSQSECGALEHAGAIPLRLGTRVLRAETAVYSGLTILQYRLGDLGASP